jgi:hypothetical protein
MNIFERPFKKRKKETVAAPEPKNNVFNRPLSLVDIEEHKRTKRAEELEKMLNEKSDS